MTDVEVIRGIIWTVWVLFKCFLGTIGSIEVKKDNAFWQSCTAWLLYSLAIFIIVSIESLQAEVLFGHDLTKTRLDRFDIT